MEVSDFTTGDRGRKSFLKVVKDSMNKQLCVCGGGSCTHTCVWSTVVDFRCRPQLCTSLFIWNLFVCLFIYDICFFVFSR